MGPAYRSTTLFQTARAGYLERVEGLFIAAQIGTLGRGTAEAERVLLRLLAQHNLSTQVRSFLLNLFCKIESLDSLLPTFSEQQNYRSVVICGIYWIPEYYQIISDNR